MGKTTLGRRLTEVWGLPYTNLDELHWGKGLKHVLGDRADTFVWLNFPRPLAWQRLFRRTVRRWLTREEAYADCLEPPLWKVLTEKGHILRWEAKTHDSWRQRAPALEREFPRAALVELRSPRQVRRWVAHQTIHPTN